MDVIFGFSNSKILQKVKTHEAILSLAEHCGHTIPTKRQDNKRVAVVKFVSRMTKFDVLSTKKQNRNFKYKGNDIFINEHLSPINRTLFARAAERKKVLGFKFVWTKNCVTFMRKNETSQIITISKEIIWHIGFSIQCGLLN